MSNTNNDDDLPELVGKLAQSVHAVFRAQTRHNNRVKEQLRVQPFISCPDEARQSISAPFAAEILSYRQHRRVSLEEAVDIARESGCAVKLTGNLYTSRVYVPLSEWQNKHI